MNVRRLSLATWGSLARVAGVLWVMVAGARVSQAEYDPYTPIVDITITTPTDGTNWPAGCERECTCTDSGDTDQEYNGEEWIDVNDSVTEYWTVTHGSFKDNDNVGTTVTYVCPNSGTSGVTLTAHADDNYAPEGNEAVVNEGEQNDSVTINIIAVDTVDWEKYTSSNLDLDTCPKNGGKRIFPGKKTATDGDAADRKKVKVKVTVTPVVENMRVYFEEWDVDDPDANTAPIDPNDTGGESIGGDNRGASGGLSAAFAETDANGQATVVLTVSMQPGDNFKIAAATCVHKLNEMNQAKADGRDALPATVKLSEMLTVWRKLHVELDSMVAVPVAGDEKNFVAGNITDIDGEGPFTAETDQELLDTDMYENGTLVKGGNHTVKAAPGANTSGANGAVTTTTNPGEGAFTSLTDDDTKVMPDFPDTGKMNAIFGDCYIECANDATGGTNTVAFDLNVGGADTSDDDVHKACARGSADEEAADWWVVYLLGGYQAGHDKDYDPAGETARAGQNESVHYQEAIVYLETIVDWCAVYGWNAGFVERQVVVHEVGHQVLESSNHTPSTIMAKNLPVAPGHDKFSDADIAIIRGKTDSPGT